MSVLNRAFNVAILHLASRVLPMGFDVGPKAPDTLEKLVDHVRRTGRVLVWDGASDRTIFGDPEVNFAFRAWHDWCHYTLRASFDRAGEVLVYQEQARQIRALYGASRAAWFCRILYAEVIGQLDHAERHGRFPGDQRAFVEAFLTNPAAALARPF